MSIAFPFWNAQNPRQKLDFFLDSFHPFSSFTAFSLVFHSATQLKFAEPERSGRRCERRGNPPSCCCRKSLLATCSLEETKCSKDTPGTSSVSTKAQGLSAPCMTESNYRDNYCYLNQKQYWQVWIWACWNYWTLTNLKQFYSSQWACVAQPLC